MLIRDPKNADDEIRRNCITSKIARIERLEPRFQPKPIFISSHKLQADSPELGCGLPSLQRCRLKYQIPSTRHDSQSNRCFKSPNSHCVEEVSLAQLWRTLITIQQGWNTSCRDWLEGTSRGQRTYHREPMAPATSTPETNWIRGT